MAEILSDASIDCKLLAPMQHNWKDRRLMQRCSMYDDGDTERFSWESRDDDSDDPKETITDAFGQSFPLMDDTNNRPSLTMPSDEALNTQSDIYKLRYPDTMDI
jgi:hypothetical protein